MNQNVRAYLIKFQIYSIQATRPNKLVESLKEAKCAIQVLKLSHSRIKRALWTLTWTLICLKNTILRTKWMSKFSFLRKKTDLTQILTMVFNNQEGLPQTSCVFNWQMSMVIRTQTKTTLSKPYKRTFRMSTRIYPNRSLSETRSILVRLSSTNLAISTRTTITSIVMTITITLIDLATSMCTQRLS